GAAPFCASIAAGPNSTRRAAPLDDDSQNSTRCLLELQRRRAVHNAAMQQCLDPYQAFHGKCL
ncbi:MAG: hypothetical protein AAFW88_01565, partial [Pseudomonadota bacterium]